MEEKKLENLIFKTIEDEKQKAFDLNEYIFDHPEIAYEEFLAYEKYLELLKDEGIEVEEKFLGIETSFKATINEDPNSDIKIGILAEYDALPEIGHACGHSASGALSFLAALGLYKNKEHLKGNIYLIGSPAEEMNGVKTDFANSRLFDDFSFVIMIHMNDKNQVKAKFMAMAGYNYEFIGKSAHASIAPWDGINAMNGMTLFIHAIDMMRQQLRDGTRAQGVILNGGAASNIIPEFASCQYVFRYKKMDYLQEVLKMAHDAAEGCAQATGTKLNIGFPGRPLADLKPTPSTDLLIESIYEDLDIEVDKGEILPLASSDIGNLSYRCPAFHPMLSISDTPVSAHTKEFASKIKSDKTKGVIEKGAKVISSLILKSLFDEKIIENMKKDFNEA